jgi:hypothetical protein
MNDVLKYIIVSTLILIHILVWVFILFAWVSNKTAKFNLYIFIPLIYILHILPFHVLTSSKEKIDPEGWKKIESDIFDVLKFPKLFVISQSKLSNYCFSSPLSPQGMMILGALTSAYKLLK